MRVRSSSVAAGALEHAQVVVDPDAQHLLDFRFVRRARGQAAVLAAARSASRSASGSDGLPAAARGAARRTNAGVTRPEP